MNIYEQYATIRKQIASLETLEADLKLKLIEDMKTKNSVKEELPFGRFSIKTRKNYTYSPAIKELEDAVKIKKIEEVEKGVAVMSETQYVEFKEVTE